MAFLLILVDPTSPLSFTLYLWLLLGLIMLIVLVRLSVLLLSLIGFIDIFYHRTDLSDFCFSWLRSQPSLFCVLLGPCGTPHGISFTNFLFFFLLPVNYPVSSIGLPLGLIYRLRPCHSLFYYYYYLKLSILYYV